MDTLSPLTCDALQSLSLPKLDKQQLITTFIRDQKAHAESHAAKGLSESAAWTSRGPENQSGEEPRPNNASKCHKKLDGEDDSLSRKKLCKSTRSQDKAVSNRNEHKTPGFASGKEKKSKKHKMSPEPDDEHAARLSERRKRKRAKKAIIKPTEPEKSNGEEEESVPSSDEQDRRRGKKRRKSKKAPNAFALMHGFEATNVGKNRLTLQPPTVGVFSRGKASAKTKVTLKKMPSKSKRYAAFSESEFLNKAQTKKLKWLPKALAGYISDSDSTSIASSVHLAARKKYVNKDPRKKSRDKFGMKKKSDISSEQSADHIESVSYRQAESEIWDIEKGCPLPSSVTPTEKEGTVVIDTRNIKWSVQNKADLTDIRVSKCGNVQEKESVDDGLLSTNSAVGDLRSNAASLRPSDSASRQVCCDSPPMQQPSATNPCSKYFTRLPGLDLVDEAAGKSGDVLDAASPVSGSHEISKITPCRNVETAKNINEGLLPSPLPGAPLGDFDHAVTAEKARESTDHLTTDSVLSSNSLERALAEYEADNQALFCRRLRPSSLFGQLVLPMATQTAAKYGFALCGDLDDASTSVGSVNAEEDQGSEYLMTTNWRDSQVDDAFGPLHVEQDLFGHNTLDQEGRYYGNSNDQQASAWRLDCHEDFQQTLHGDLDDYDYEMNYFENSQELPCPETTADDLFQSSEYDGILQYHDMPATQYFSDASSDTDTDAIGILGGAEVYQDRGLFLTLPSDPKGNFPAPRPFSAIRRAEADVVKGLRDHWRPVRL